MNLSNIVSTGILSRYTTVIIIAKLELREYTISCKWCEAIYTWCEAKKSVLLGLILVSAFTHLNEQCGFNVYEKTVSVLHVEH